ncbi:MAG: polyphenol oxidase family protein [Patescibacteria group bacterium]|mgnify:CR=1 FL=1
MRVFYKISDKKNQLEIPASVQRVEFDDQLHGDTIHRIGFSRSETGRSIDTFKNIAKVTDVGNFQPVKLTEIEGVKNSRLQNFKNEVAGDAFITNLQNIALTIRVADCISVMLFDPVANAIGNIHAGWRGVAAGIIPKTVEAMAHEFGSEPRNVTATMSPSIGPCCFVMTDPKNELPEHMHAFIIANNVDLWRAAESQLMSAGINATNISNPRLCTACNSDTFHSSRKGDKGRFYTAIWLTE